MHRPFTLFLVRPSFISYLFEHRESSYSRSARAGGRAHGSIFISWVDVVLAKLGEAILLISGRGNYNFSRSYQLTVEEKAVRSFWNSRNQKEQAIRVASQLPGQHKSWISEFAKNFLYICAILCSNMAGYYRHLRLRHCLRGCSTSRNFAHVRRLRLAFRPLQRFRPELEKVWKLHTPHSMALTRTSESYLS